MSDLVVQVVEIEEVLPHPNADRLALAVIGGWQFVTGKDTYKKGDRVVYFPVDTVLPGDVAERLGVRQYLKNGERVQAVKLRGEPSFGVVAPLDNPEWEVGQDVAEHYGATKWEPPARDFRRSVSGQQPQYSDALPENPYFHRYTDIQNLRHYKYLFADDEPVYVTEKLHGTSCRIGMVDGQWLAGCGKGRLRKPMEECTNAGSFWYWYPRTLPGVERLIAELGAKHKQVILFGEVFGSGVQNLDYGYTRGEIAFRAFDLMLDGQYVNPGQFLLTLAQYDVPVVPVFGFDIPYRFERIKELAEGPTLLGAPHIREGAVVKPQVERTHPKVGRLVLKYVSDAYLTGKNTDFRED